MMDNFETIYFWMATGVGSVVIIVGVVIFVRSLVTNRRLKNGGASSVGKVSQVHASISQLEDSRYEAGGGQTKSYRYTISYTHMSQPVEGILDKSRPTYKEGEQLTVYYLPEDTSRVYDKPGHIQWAGLVLVFGGCMALFFGSMYVDYAFG